MYDQMFQRENDVPPAISVYFLTSLERSISVSAIHSSPELRPADYEQSFMRRSEQYAFLRRRICLYRVLNDYFVSCGLNRLDASDTLKFGAFGKPFLARADGSLYKGFNLSTRSDSLIIGLAAVDGIGVDVEDSSRTMKPASLSAVMEYYFSVHERNFVFAVDDDYARRVRFLDLWTRKEAAVKVVGQSVISHGLQVNGLSSPWLVAEDGIPVQGCSLTIPGKENLLASIALKTRLPIDESYVQKKDARALYFEV